MTGFRLDSPEFCIAKLRWIQTQQPGVWAQTRRVLTISDYLTFALTGEFAGDAGTASLLGLWNRVERDWWDEALDAAGLRRSRLVAPLMPGTVAGVVSSIGAQHLGIPAGIPFAVGGLDHYVAALGAVAGRWAPVSESTGTVVAVIAVTPEFLADPNWCVGPGAYGRGWYRLAFDGNGAGVLEWYQGTHAADATIDDLLRLAGEVPIRSDGLVARPDARGFRNVRSIHTRGHYVRAILESVAATLTDLVDKVSPDAIPACIVATGGGARSDLWLQIKANMLGVRFVTTQCPEPACLGAALFAAVAAGWDADLEAAQAIMTSVRRSYDPDPGAFAAYRQWCNARRSAEDDSHANA